MSQLARMLELGIRNPLAVENLVLLSVIPSVQ